jgi:hypothetical protein
MTNCNLFGIRRLVSKLLEEYTILHMYRYQGSKSVLEEKFIRDGLDFLRTTEDSNCVTLGARHHTTRAGGSQRPVLTLVRNLPEKPNYISETELKDLIMRQEV